MSRPAVPEAPPAAADVLADLERRLARVERAVGTALDPVPSRVPAPPPPAPPVAAAPTRPRLAIDEAVLGGRLLAWAGGGALLLALGTLFWLGVRDGWIGEPVRCLLGALASGALLAAGLRNARRGVAREASWAMAGTGLGGLYATVAVATATYELLPDAVGLALLGGLGVASALLALRWEAQPLAGVGLLGALAAPVIAPVDGLVLPVVIVAMAATGLLLRHRPWTWLAAAASVPALPQVVWHVGVLLDDLQGPDAGIATIAVPGLWTLAALAAGLAMVAGWELRAPRAHERWSVPLLLVAHAGVAAALAGSYALVDLPVAAVVTLVAAAALLSGAAAVVRRRAGATTAAGLALLSAAVLVLDLGFAIGASGMLQLAGWAVAAVALAAVARIAARADLPVVIGGLGLHAGLALVEAVGVSGDGDGAFLAACAVLAGVCAVSARVVAPRSPEARAALDVGALAVVLWWTAATLPADRLALVLASEAAALLLIDRRVGDAVARGAGLVALALAGVLALAHTSGSALWATWGVVPDGEAWALALPLLAVAGAAAVGVVTLRGVVLGPASEVGDDARAAVTPGTRGAVGAGSDESDPLPGALAVAAGGAGLLAVSILVGAATVGLSGGTDAVAVVRDVLWASSGLALLAAGLARGEAPLRVVGLGLLAGVGGKIALIDLADVDTAGRVVAWAVLGALLLAGAALYGRVRPRGRGVGEDVAGAGPSATGPGRAASSVSTATADASVSTRAGR